MSETMNGRNMTPKAHDYREGFFEGARAILKAIGDDLPDEQMRVLKNGCPARSTPGVTAMTMPVRRPLPMIDGA